MSPSSTEDDMLKEAIAGTENEIFSEAVGKDLPSTEGGPGDRSVEEMGTGLEGQVEAEEPDADEVAAGAEEGTEAEEGKEGEQDQGDKPRDPKTGEFVAKTEPKPAAKAEGDKPVDPKARVPLAELLTERKARQALEDQLKTEKDARA